MRNRNLVSLSIAFGFVAVALTGLCLYFGIKADAVEIIHVLFGLLFTGLIVFHILYNFSSLKNYTRDRKTRRMKKELLISLSVSTLLLVTMCSGLPVLEDLSHAGRSLFGFNKKSDRKRPDQGAIFNEISTNRDIKGTPLHLIIQVNRNVVAPIMAIWTEDSTNKGVETLFLPTKKMERPSASSSADLLPEFTKRSPDHRPNYDHMPPAQSFILDTHTHAGNRFTIYLEMRYKDTIELYTAAIDSSTSKLFVFTGVKHDLLREGIIRIH